MLKGRLALLFCAVDHHVIGKANPWLQLDAAGEGGRHEYLYYSSGLSLLRGSCCLNKVAFELFNSLLLVTQASTAQISHEIYISSYKLLTP